MLTGVKFAIYRSKRSGIITFFPVGLNANWSDVYTFHDSSAQSPAILCRPYRRRVIRGIGEFYTPSTLIIARRNDAITLLRLSAFSPALAWSVEFLARLSTFFARSALILRLAPFMFFCLRYYLMRFYSHARARLRFVRNDLPVLNTESARHVFHCAVQ